MKLLISAFITLVATTAMAGGKLTYQYNVYEGGKDSKHMMGLAVYQKLMKKAAYNSWTGFGTAPEFYGVDGQNWVTTKHQLDIYIKNFTLAPGVQVDWVDDEIGARGSFFVKTEYKLW